jgi:hypothetical protein
MKVMATFCTLLACLIPLPGTADAATPHLREKSQCNTSVVGESHEFGGVLQQTHVEIGVRCSSNLPHEPVKSAHKVSPAPRRVVASPVPDRCGSYRGRPAPFLSPVTSDQEAQDVVWLFCWSPVIPAPSPSPSPVPASPATQRLSAQAVRLLPVTPVGTTVLRTGFTRPNIQTIFWADTTPSIDLGSVTLLAQQFTLRADFTRAVWNFGDHTPAVATTHPGKAYIPGTCDYQPQCPDYFGHTYRTKGTVTVTLTVTWTIRYTTSTSADTWTTLPTPLTTPPATAAINIISNHAILIPNPDDSH